METCAYIADQLVRTFGGQAWHGDSVMQILSDIGPQQAARKSLQNIHSIWEIVLHIIAWEQVVVQCLQGNPYTKIHGEDDWPPVKEVTSDAWRVALQLLTETTSTLNALISSFPEHQLHEKVPGQTRTYYQLFHGVVQHNLYHAGQIGILKKL